jgi:DNA-binding LacI/PurR family transcriptional regulator
MFSHPPVRATLHDQLVSLLREGIENARWVRELPSEAELCREFHVSRMTLRKALAHLANEKWIVLGGRGSLHHIRSRPSSRKAPPARTIRILTPYALARMGSIENQLIETLSERVTAAGYRLEAECHPRIFENFQPEKLVHLDTLPGTAAWLLFLATEEIQRWFAATGRPAVVVGQVHHGVPLSSICSDTPAAARHAAGLLCSRGHRDLVYLIANLTSLGDRHASEAFVAEARRLGARARIVNYDNDAPSVGRVVQGLIASRPRPTGYVIGASEVAIAVLCHLQTAGIRVPMEAGVVALWADERLDFTFPTIARYHTDGRMMGRNISRALLDLIRHGPGRVRSIEIMPEFVTGGSIGSGGLR